MKKFICLMLTITLIFSSVSVAEAKRHDSNHNDPNHNDSNHQDSYDKTIYNYKIHEQKNIIKYGQYKLPINPITQAMGAFVSYNKNKAVLVVSKGTTRIIINFKRKLVVVNNVEDKNSGIFSASNNKKMIVLIKYIAGILGVSADICGDDITIKLPGINAPTNVTVTPVGSVIVSNTLNCSSICLNASANITAGQATGGRAELYVGTKLIAIDSVISATDNMVTFTTSDGAPNNAKLQAAVPLGGVVSVKLYDAAGNCTVSSSGNPTLVTDYKAPTLASINSAAYDALKSQLTINVTGASDNSDLVDVTKLSLYDSTLGRTVQLTNTAGTGSYGKVTGSNTLLISIGSMDKYGLSGIGTSAFNLYIAAGSLLYDAAGNSSNVTPAQYIPVSTSFVSNQLTAPTNVTLTPVGTIDTVNTLNSTTLNLAATAKITPGQAAGGKAELYIGSRLVATDTSIGIADNIVSFNTSDGSPTNAELQALIPSGGIASVKLYNIYNNSAVSTVSNPTLTVDYIAPTIGSVISAIYNKANSQLNIMVSGAGYAGDLVDVTKLSLYDLTLGRTWQLTNYPTTGSTGTVQNAASLVITIGSADRIGLAGFGSSTVYLSVAAGALLKDIAGNLSSPLAATQLVPVTVLNSTQPQGLNAPTNVTVTPVGSMSPTANTLNISTLYMDAGAQITPGQATGGRAELFVGSKLIASDFTISQTDTTVNFTTSDGTPSNSELQTIVPVGGLVTVKLYNVNNQCVASSVGNPTLTVDYIAPTITEITSAIFDVKNSVLYLLVKSAGAIGDQADVTKIVMYDTATGKGYTMTTGSSGAVSSSTTITFKLGSADKLGLAGFSGTSVVIIISPGAFLKDQSGNTSLPFPINIQVPVTVIQ